MPQIFEVAAAAFFFKQTTSRLCVCVCRWEDLNLKALKCFFRFWAVAAVEKMRYRDSIA